MKVPLLDLKAQFASVEPEVRAAIDRVLASQEYILGSECVALESELAAFCGVGHGVGISNGSDAILVALLALGIGPGDEVIVPTFTFFATAGSVSRTGARPVFVDVLPDTFNIDPAAVEAAITPRTRAIVPVHLYGQCADMDRLGQIAARHGLKIVEDSAQAIGATFNGRRACSFGAAGTLSFYPTKNLSAIGEGGMVLTGDAQLAETMRQIRNHGQADLYFHRRIGGNYRLDGIQAAALRVKLARLEDWTQRRRQHAKRYDEALADVVTVPPVDPRCTHVYHQYTIRAASRDALRKHLADAGIGTGVYYPLPLHLQPCFADLGYREGQFPVAEQASREVLSLPIFPEMSPAQQDYVIATIRQFRGG